MPTKSTIPFSSGMFFITFTCYKWLPLIDKVNGYDLISKQRLSSEASVQAGRCVKLDKF